MRVDDLLECCLYADDVEATARFYEEVLGLECVARAAGRHVFFRCGGRMLLLFNPARTATSEDVPPHGAVGAGHVAFAVPAARIDAWRRHLEEAGVVIEREVEWPRGGRSLYVRDPAGNSVELAPPGIWG